MFRTPIGSVAILTALTACQAPKPDRATNVSQLEQSKSIVMDIMHGHHSPSNLPIPFNDGTPDSYRLGETGVTLNGISEIGVPDLSVDRGSIYFGQGWDGMATSINGSVDYYTLNDVFGTPVSLSDAFLIGNGESEQTGGFEPLEQAFPFGSVYVMFSEVGVGEFSCETKSAQRYVSDEMAAISPFLGAIQETFPDAIEQSEREDWPFIKPHNNSGIQRSFFTNIAGGIESNPFEDTSDSPYKLEFGLMGQSLTYQNYPIAVLPDDFIADNPEICLRVYESDLAGATPFLEFPFPMETIRSALQENTGSAEFQIIMAHDASEEGSVFLGLYQDGVPLRELIELDDILDPNILDVSQSLKEIPVTDPAFFTRVGLEIGN